MESKSFHLRTAVKTNSGREKKEFFWREQNLLVRGRKARMVCAAANRRNVEIHCPLRYSAQRKINFSTEKLLFTCLLLEYKVLYSPSY